MRILLLSGSFHSKSISLGILNHIVSQMHAHETDIPAINTLPFFSEDLSNDNKPDNVALFLQQVNQADAIICCLPEYNHSVPAVLKNAIDWASRPAFRSPLKDKPVTIITQANSPVGGARAQAHLKLIFDSTLSRIHSCHEMLIAEVNDKFDEQQNLTDDKTKQRLNRHMDDFMAFID